ncbi:MAG: response regulator transcription factor [Nitratireductor sp.]|nr:response regulator transcription factor [Nitratireductor sp.]
MTPGTIIVADDHPLFRDALRQAIETLGQPYKVEMAGEFERVEALLDSTPESELVLLDLNMPGNNGLSGLLRLRSSNPGIPVVIVSANEEASTVRRALDMGASGYIPKSSTAEQIRNAIRAVLDGEVWVPPHLDLSAAEDSDMAELIQRLQTLTPQQNRVLSMLGEGLLNKQIAYELGVSEATVKAHVSAVLLKLGVDSRTQAVIALGRLGLSAANG